MHEMCAAALAGDRDKAGAINEKLLLLHRDLFLEANPIPAKWALHEMGMIGEAIRLPLTPLSEQYRAQIRMALEHAGIVA